MASETEPTIGIIGCGSMGTAILKGLISGNNEGRNFRKAKFQASVTSQDSANSVRGSVQSTGANVEVFVGHHVDVAAAADVVLLTCPPDKMRRVLSAEGMRDALQGKTLISLLAGVTSEDIRDTILSDEGSKTSTGDKFWVIRAMTNLAVSDGVGANMLEIVDPPLPKDQDQLVLDIWQQLGGTTYVAPDQMDAATVLCGSTPAFFALFADALIDGAVAAGVDRPQAQIVLKSVMSSTAAMLKIDAGPSDLRENICMKAGCTMSGILTLEQGNVRGAASKAMFEAIQAAAKLGKKN